MEYRERILALARRSPLLPSSLARALGSDSIMAGAMLSELCEKGALKASSLKVGGSPLYYIPGNEFQLLEFTSHLNEKDRATLDLLRKYGVLRERECDPLTRVSLMSLKDFAKPLVVQYDGIEERFWKWFEVGDEMAKELIANALSKGKSGGVAEEQDGRKESGQREESKAQSDEQKESAEKSPDVGFAESKEEVPESSKVASSGESGTAKSTEKSSSISSGDFWDRINSFLSSNKIALRERVVVKKGKEFDLVIGVPSPVGMLSYFCKARSKKRVSDKDLSAAYVQGQLRKLPVIFMTDGDLTKKAREVVGKMSGLTVKRVGDGS
ncbi:hypothetical protein D6825_01100 [Candidatus Woesearchaeota archaeon]|nr:MAG: hypothetical protein D6825_01100 [Candidatus Woesearchaeota archaeon]